MGPRRRKRCAFSLVLVLVLVFVCQIARRHGYNPEMCSERCHGIVLVRFYARSYGRELVVCGAGPAHVPAVTQSRDLITQPRGLAARRGAGV